MNQAHPNVMAAVMSPAAYHLVTHPDAVSKRRVKVRKMLADGKSYRDIAQALGVTRARVGQIVKRMRQLGLA